jgi:hypothetical protein
MIDMLKEYEEWTPTLKLLTDKDSVTSAPHAYGGMTRNFMYFNHYGIADFDPVANTREAIAFYNTHGLTMSKYLVPHYYEISSSAIPIIRNEGSICSLIIIMVPKQLIADLTGSADMLPDPALRYLLTMAGMWFLM